VTLRHIPIAQDSFAFYGDDLLPNYNALPTWAYTTPHNIQRITPQTESCDACHGNADLFLTADKIYPEELEANLSLIVDVIPAPISEITATTTITTTTVITSTVESP
jgi:thiosulfate/3-mercaptopyruvate sulfurtransferase